MTKLYQGLWSILIIIGFIFVSGCSPTINNTQMSGNSRGRQIALQRQLQKLNKQNEKLQQVLAEASVINIESSDSLENNAVIKEKIPEMTSLLQDFRKVNLETQAMLDELNQSIKNDSEKNATIGQMLDGFSAECEQQQSRLDRIKESLDASKGSKWNGDNVHIGISSQYLTGAGNIINNDFGGNTDYNVSGSTVTAYFTYVGEYNTAIGFKYMVITNKLKPEVQLSNDGYYAYEARLGLFSMGYRIPSVKIFNIVPEVLYGVGESTISACDKSSCNSVDYFKSNIRAVGMEIPFYHQMSSAFSWGFKLSGYRIISDSGADYYKNKSKQASLDLKQEYTVAGLGAMLGFAW